MELDQIYLGDCYEEIKKIPDKSIDLIVTDPPYKIEGLGGNKGGLFKGRTKTQSYQELNSNGLDLGITKEILDEMVRVMKKINIYIWCSKSQIIQLLDYFVKERGCNFEILIWAKTNPPPFNNRTYLSDKEYCLYFRESGAYANIPYERAKTFFITSTNTKDKKDYDHPTIKPLEIIETLIENSSGGGR